MKNSAKKFLALLVLSGLIVAALSGVALASPPWSDASATWWQTNYGVSESDVATVADGFPDGTFRPSVAVTRGQFAKMAVSGLGVATLAPGYGNLQRRRAEQYAVRLHRGRLQG